MRILLTLALFLFIPVIAAAQHNHSAPMATSTSGEVAFVLYPERVPSMEKSIRVIAQLTLDGKPLTDDELKTVHTKKFHLLIVDPTLTDYHHVHPEPTATPGSYRFTFTPKFSGSYRGWADVTPMAGGEQQFAMADLGDPPPSAVKIDKKDADHAVVSDYRFGLSCDEVLVEGEETMCGVSVTDNSGQPVKTLEPVMGAFAHLVGFYDDYETILHAHPMGEEPKNDNARGGPTLMFHLEPEQAGFVRLFLQVKINGKELSVPFGIHIAAAASPE